MLRRTAFLLRYLLLLIAVFVCGHAGFLIYNAKDHLFNLADFFLALAYALPQDFVTAVLLCVVPWLVSALGLWLHRMPLRLVLAPYYLVAGFLVGAITVADACMYEFWGFKLSVVILRYAASPEGATNSVSIGFILARVGTALAIMALTATVAIRYTPHSIGTDRPSRTLMERYLADVVILLGLAFQLTFMHVGSVYHSSELFLNHAATNPVYAFFASWKPTKGLHQQYRLMPADEAQRTFAPLYAPMSDKGTPSLLRTQHPDVLIVMVESYGAKFVKELGGLPDVAPQLSRLIPEGIFFDHCYASSFRTDRGTASIYNGSIAYPNLSLMTETRRHASLPSLSRTFARAGYATSYLLGGPMTNMGKEQYLRDIGFTTLYNDKRGFTPQELATGSWGADDSITAQRTVEILCQRSTVNGQHVVPGRKEAKAQFMGYQTLSSHEPFDVPYHRLPSDTILNAFAYTDACLGQLVDSLRQTPEWDNLLVVILADHGFMYGDLSYQDPEFFHIPLLWLGGAIREPRRVATLMNQSDLAATLLAQLGLPHADYPWSRNILSPAYRYPFAYSNSPAALLFADTTGTTVYDLTASRILHTSVAPGQPAHRATQNGAQRLRRAKAILQTSYDRL